MDLKPPEQKVEFGLTYMVTFYFKNRQMVNTIDAVMSDRSDRNELEVPDDWDIKRSSDIQTPWVEFESEQPFKKQDLNRVRRHLQKLDDAFTAMKK